MKKKLRRPTTAALPKATRSERIARQVSTLAEPVCAAEGIELVWVEFHPETAGRVLRLYIDKPGGVTLEDCVTVSRQITDLLDVSVDEMGPYNLEVTSPGPERPLGKAEDFNRFRGRKAKVQTVWPIDGRKNFTGILAGFLDGQVTLTIDKKTVAMPHEWIKRARLVNHGE